jgi:predicted metal-binding membrane protein
MWMRMPGQTWAGAAAAFLAVWVVMMVAMMLPPLLPMLSSYRRTTHPPVTMCRDGLTALAAAGYFSAWAVFGAGAYVMGIACATAELRWSAVARAAPLATGVALLLAGGVQLTGWKVGQLARCRHCGPAGAPDARSAYRYGLRYGVHCCLCCVGLMTLLLVTGMMRLGAIAAVAATITAERLAPTGRQAAWIARAAGTVILVVGAGAIARAWAVEDAMGRARARESRQAAPVERARGIRRVVGSRPVTPSVPERALPRETATERERQDAGR